MPPSARPFDTIHLHQPQGSKISSYHQTRQAAAPSLVEGVLLALFDTAPPISR